MTQRSARIELTLDDYADILRRRWVLVLAAVAIGSGLTTFIGLTAPPRYSATASVLLADSAAQEALDPANANPALLSRQMENEINFARSDLTVALVEEQLEVVPHDSVVIVGVGTADVLSFTATAPNPEDAARFANVWAEAYVTTKQIEAEKSITSAVDRLELQLNELQEQRLTIRQPLDELRDEVVAASVDDRPLLQVRTERLADDLAPALQLIDLQIARIVESVGDLELNGEVARSGTARVFQIASPPDAPTSAPLWRTALLGIGLGLAAGLVLALIAEMLDKTVKTPEDVVAVTSLPVLGSIPRPGRGARGEELALALRDQATSPVADGYRRVFAALQFSLLGQGVKSILVTSANQSEGKTTTSANLACALSGPNRRVALVDVDFRRPRLHTVMSVPMEPGLSDHLVDGTPLEEVAVYLDTERMLALVTCGGLPPNPTEFLLTAEFGVAIRTLVDAADMVILDGPPLLPVADSLALAQYADAVILTALAGQTRKDHLRTAVDSVHSVGGRVIGVVLTGVKRSADYGYGYQPDGPRARMRWRRRRPADLAGIPASSYLSAYAALDRRAQHDQASGEEAEPIRRPDAVPAPGGRISRLRSSVDEPSEERF